VVVLHSLYLIYKSWEQWHLHVVVNNTPRPVSDDCAAVIERQRIQDTAEGMLRSVLMKVYEIAGASIDHVPPVMYEFEISCTKKVDDRENVYSRVTNMPNLINLSNWLQFDAGTNYVVSLNNSFWIKICFFEHSKARHQFLLFGGVFGMESVHTEIYIEN